MTAASKFQEVVGTIKSLSDSGDIFDQVDDTAIQPYVVVKPSKLLQVCELVHEYPKLFFDSLNCITAIDNGTDAENRFEVIYHLYSLLNEEFLIIKVFADINEAGDYEIPSVTSIWKTADWHEREAYDLMGINFLNHPDLRRILLPADWVGHPLRKDYEVQETYHGIKVKYE
jgi:NADH-quinone oxidoreductase subunit C